MGTGELTEQPDEMLSKGLGGGSFYLVFHNYFDPIDLFTEEAFRQ